MSACISARGNTGEQEAKACGLLSLPAQLVLHMHKPLLLAVVDALQLEAWALHGFRPFLVARTRGVRAGACQAWHMRSRGRLAPALALLLVASACSGTHQRPGAYAMS